MGWLSAMFRRRIADSDVDKELRSHVEQQIDDYVRAGMSRAEAARRTRLEFGGLQQIKEECRDVRALRWLDDASRDVRFAARMLAKAPAFTTVAVVTLALGIGANTAIFSVVHALILKQLPYAADSDRLVRLFMNTPAADSPEGAPLRLPVTFTAGEMADLQSHARTLAKVGAAGRVLRTLTGGVETARLQGERISASVFQMLGARPLRGRPFSGSDDTPGAEAVIILGYGAWQQYFHGDPNILNRTLTVTDILPPHTQRSYAVVGVMPQTFAFPDSQTQFWIPFAADTGTGAPLRGPLLAQLADGVTLQAAAAEVESIIRTSPQPPRNAYGILGKPTSTYELVREHDELVAPVKPGLFALTVAVGFVLLIACVNVANLLLARTAARHREIAIRAAVGAGRGRLIRQALTESVLLALLGGAAAVGLALAGIRLLHALATTLPRFDLPNGVAFPRIDEIGLDIPVLAFTTAVSLATGLLFGLTPALRSSRLNPKDAVADVHGSRARNTLVIAEIGMAMVLLVGSGLLIRSFLNLTSVRLGYQPANVLTFQVGLPSDRYPDNRLKMFAEDLIVQLRSVPRVQFAASANQLPMVNIKDTAGGLWHTPDTKRGLTPAGDCRLVSRDYFKVMDIRVIAGRGFDDSDGEGRPRVLLVNDLLAHREFPGQDPIGKSVYLGADPTPWQIVGVVDNVRQFGFDREAEPQFFVDLRQWTSATVVHVFPVGAYFAVRTDGNPTQVIANVRRIVGHLDAQASLFNVAPMPELVATTVAQPRMYAVLLGIFAGVGVLLALVGIYGVISYSVTQRTREIGVRMAIGAQPRDVQRLVLRQGMTLFAVGALIGIAGAAALTRYLASMLVGLTPLDPATYVLAAVTFGVVALLSTRTPARRAARLDPAVTLRSE